MKITFEELRYFLEEQFPQGPHTAPCRNWVMAGQK